MSKCDLSDIYQSRNWLWMTPLEEITDTVMSKASKNPQKKNNHAAEAASRRHEGILLRKSRRRTFLGRTVGLVLLLVLAVPVTLTAFQPTTPVTPVASETATPEPTESTPPMTDTERAAQGIATSTMNVVAEQLVEQFGEEIGDTVKFGSQTNYEDDQGNPAVVALTTLHNIPLDYNWQESVANFKENLGTLGESWKWEENTEAPEGVEFIHDLFMYATEPAESSPASAVRVTYMQETDAETMTVTVSVTSYDENTPTGTEAPASTETPVGTEENPVVVTPEPTAPAGE